MSDPQDLLYTNQFLTTNIISTEELQNNTKYSSRFTDYIENTFDNKTKDYINNNEYEDSQINIERSSNQPWPIDKNKNHYPLFDKYTNDLASNKYKKNIITKINIDSKNRNVNLYLNPNSFSINFGKTFNNISKIVINDIIFPNINESITNVDNNLAWQYPSQDILLQNKIDETIIPVPDSLRTITYSSLPNSVYKYTTDGSTSNYSSTVNNYLVYQTNVPPGFYYLEQLTSIIKSSCSSILHGSNSSNIIEEPYLAFKNKIGNPTLISCSINPSNSIVRFVNRIEEINISAIQTFSPYDYNFEQDDIFYNFSSNTTYKLNQSLIYITVPAIQDITYQFYNNISNVYLTNPFPLVITNLSNFVGNIDSNIINYTTFFDLSIYLARGYSEIELQSISYYKFIDTITLTTKINDKTLTSKYLRFGLHLSSGLLNGNLYNNKGNTIKPACTENIVFSQSINNFLKNYGNVAYPVSINTSPTTVTNYNTAGIVADYKFEPNNVPDIGRALLFRWIYDKNNGQYVNYEVETINQKKRTLLHLLAWPIANQTENIYTLLLNSGFSFVNTNTTTSIVTEDNNLAYYSLNNNFPSQLLNLQYYSGKYFLKSPSYVFLKLNFYSNTSYSNIINNYSTNYSDNFITANSELDLQYNQIYVLANSFNVGIGEDYTCAPSYLNLKVYKKDYSGVFCKFLLSSIGGNTDITTSNVINNNSFVINYNKLLNDITSVSIEVLNSNFEIISSSYNYSFTLNIHEDKYILKETLIDTKTDNVTSIGNYV
jgi:hypothetical protein